ncbi:T9SS type A sorting domain-containing protein [Pedobacter glucosidilyticus]|uniref:T9SS type A sorting domain-containing protein n=1 Tax=Pedobacter glucosidilyticus TaxID=1122941 RepID=UPI00041A0F84|nr:T9SS type A sorting domain-containing protein [Pedobacter glucosidilyticus]
MMKNLLVIIFISITHLAAKAQCTATITAATSNPTSTSACSDNIIIYTINGATGATSYNWTITGASSSRISDTQYTVLIPNTVGTIINISVAITGGVCNGSTISKNITVAAQPTKPVINRAANSNTLTTPTVAGATYQWYFNRTPVAGATSNSFPIQNTGFYAVEIKNNGGCSTYSDDFTYFSTSVKEDPKFAGFAYYPNPVETGNSLTVMFSDTYDIELIDITGKSVLNKKSLKGKQELETNNLNAGVYLLKVESEGKLTFRKIIIN